MIFFFSSYYYYLHVIACHLSIFTKLSVLTQIPGSSSTTYSLALYYMMNSPVEDTPLLESFIKGDDAYRNSRFKLIPYISKVGTCNDCCNPVGMAYSVFSRHLVEKKMHLLLVLFKYFDL